MRKKTVFGLSFLLAAAILLSACGAGSEIAAEPSPEPTETPAPTIELPESVIGTWISMNDPADTLVFSKEGELFVNGTQIELLETTENGVRYLFGGSEGVISVSHGYLSCGFPLPLSERSAHTFCYRSGEDNPADRFVGTWTLCDGEGSLWNGAAVQEFMITDDGSLLLGDEAFPIGFQMTFDGGNDCGWMLQADGDRLWCSFFNDDPDALSLGTGDGWGKYYKDLMTAELSLDNWRDFFDFVIVYSLGRDDAGNPYNSMARFMLAEKGDHDILCIRGGAASVTSTPKTCSMIQYDLKSGEYGFRELTTKERGKYNNNYFLSYRNRTVNETFRKFEDGVLPGGGWGLSIVVFSENTLVRDGGTVTAATITEFYSNLSKISGTVYYRDASGQEE